MDLDKGLISGATILMLLKLLQEQDRYGYEIIGELQRRSDNTFCFKEGTLYPVLHKMENQGLLKSYQKTGENGKSRKYYGLTPRGTERLKAEREQWTRFTTSVEKVVGGVCFA